MAIPVKEALDSIRKGREFKSRASVRDAVAEHATNLQDLILQINEIVPPGLGTDHEVNRDKEKTKIVTTTVDPAEHKYFLYPFRIIEKEYHVEPNWEQFNGAAKPAWSLRFDGKLEENEKEDFFPFFEFTRLTSGECIVKYSSQTGGECGFDSRQLNNAQELGEQIRLSYNALADLGIDPYLLNEHQLLPSEQML